MDINYLIGEIDKQRNNQQNSQERIARVLENRQVDVLPLIFWRPHSSGSGTAVIATPGTTYTMKEQFFDKEKMLAGHLEEMYEIATDTYDGLFCIRPNFGTIFIPAILDLDYTVPENDYPWLTRHLTKKEIKNMHLPDLDKSSMLDRAVEYMEYFQEILPDWIHVYLPDTQGPFDLAHLLYGDNLFMDIYDDPDFVHNLMEITTEIYIKVTEKLKNVINEPRAECYHGHALPRGIYMRNGGTRISEDTATLISPDDIDEFVIPYDKKALKAFGGGFVHYCGHDEYLLQAYLEMGEVTAINFGNPEEYDFEETMRKFMKYDTCYFGLWPSYEGESLDGYINRMMKVIKGNKGLLLHFNQEDFQEYSTREILQFWRECCQQ